VVSEEFPLSALLRAVVRYTDELADELRAAIVIGKLNRLLGTRKRTLWYLDGPDLERCMLRLMAALALSVNWIEVSSHTRREQHE